tara:strand:+ start:961 stop:1326 length:366 start_codon:yes stop_codon:yes gene_type:complete
MLASHGWGFIVSFRGLEKHLRLIEEFRKLYPEMQSQTIACFLYVAHESFVMNKDIRVTDIGAFLDLTSASTSRNLAILSKYNHLRKLDLIQAEENPERRIEKFVTLTPKGKRVAKRIMEML